LDLRQRESPASNIAPPAAKTNPIPNQVPLKPPAVNAALQRVWVVPATKSPFPCWTSKLAFPVKANIPAVTVGTTDRGLITTVASCTTPLVAVKVKGTGLFNHPLKGAAAFCVQFNAMTAALRRDTRNPKRVVEVAGVGVPTNMVNPLSKIKRLGCKLYIRKQ